MDADPLTRADFRRLIPIRRPQPIAPPPRIWTAEQWARIRYGVNAELLDERWLALVEGDRLHLHRSWTGYGVYRADFAPCPGGRRIRTAWVEGDRARYRRGSDRHEAVLLETVIRAVILNRESAALERRLLAAMGLAEV
ncbi:hypothetical protein SAMN05444365_105147 [Micromonospora pattaloongensis]|uniref:Uncharacterized protein n=1 Tax=Micromonospora pattaloongensis TaxID=405436 RepID=A0A1H3PZV7_9ACTN|nr:hypothetical protein [Micromonospora pattaloongensis]SDZ06802.1 hypothetical protein SAMN05444365_105147 [Micromonospora pattaloongensis]